MRINKTEFLKYYNLGYSDVKISKILGCSQVGVCLFRHRLGLPANSVGPGAKKANFRFINKLMEYYYLGYSDYKIADLLECSNTCVGIYRKELGLPSYHLNKDPTVHKMPIMADSTMGTILEDYTPSDEDKPWIDPESLYCDDEFLEKIKTGSKLVEKSEKIQNMG